MSTASSEDFLSGQGVPVEMHEIESQLTRLWGSAAEEVNGAESEPGGASVTRIAVANLVVFGHAADVARWDGVLDTVTALHPSRTIVLCRDDAPGRALRAEVSALCHLPAPGMPQVCSERIILRAGPDAVNLLPGAVRPLLEADLPFLLWWTHDPRDDEAIFRDLGDECSRLILDLPDPDTDPTALRLGLDDAVCPFARDVAWFGITRWRELIAQLFDPPCHHETLARINRVKLELISATPDATRGALWLIAWLAGQLGWSPIGTPDRASGRVSARFQGPTGEVETEVLIEIDPARSVPIFHAATLTTRPDGDHVATGAESFRLARVDRTQAEVHVEIDSTAYCTIPRTVKTPVLSRAQRVSAAIESSRNDPPFRKALPHLLWLLGESSHG